MGPTPYTLSPMLIPPPHELEQAIFRALRKAIFLAVGLFVLFQFLGAVTFLVLFFSVVLLLAAALNPVVVWLQRRRIPRPASAAVLVVLVLGGVVSALWFAFPPLFRQAQELAQQVPTYWNDLAARTDPFLSKHPELIQKTPRWSDLLVSARPYVNYLLGQVGQYAVNLAGILVSLVLLVILVAFTLASPEPLVAGLLGAFPEQHRPKAEEILGLVLTRLKSWAVGSLTLGIIMGVAIGTGLYLLKVPFALVFGVIAGIGELIPNLGPLLSATPPILVALAIDPGKAVLVAILFLVAQQLENALLVPWIMGKTLNLHPLSVAFMMLVMGALFGIVGAIVAVPAATVIKTIYEELYLTRHVTDPDALKAQSERVIAEEGTPAEAAVKREA